MHTKGQCGVGHRNAAPSEHRTDTDNGQGETRRSSEKVTRKTVGTEYVAVHLGFLLFRVKKTT